MIYTLLKIDVGVAAGLCVVFPLLIHRVTNAYKRKYPEEEYQKAKFMDKLTTFVQVLILGLAPCINVVSFLYVINLFVCKSDEEVLKIFMDHIIKTN